MLFIFFPDVCDTMCSAWFYFRLMDLALSSDAYQGAEATCSSTVFSPSPDWAKQIEDFTNVMWQAVHPSTKQIPQLLSMVSFRISHLDAGLKYAFERLYISDLDIYTPCQTAYPPLMDSNSLFTAFYLSYPHISDRLTLLSVCSQTSLSFDSSTEMALWLRLLQDRNLSVLLQN